MNSSRRPLFPDQNPFSTVNVKPGAIAFQFGGNISAASLIAQLKQNDWRGQIVGPHGSGKSTLLKTLIPEMEATGRVVRGYFAKPNDQRLDMFTADQAIWTAATQVVIEGYELLSQRTRRMLDRVCREKQSGLLITCHKPQGLPALYETSITVEMATSLVESLLPEDCDFITADDARDSFSRHGQNLRELFFELYDLYEQRRPPELPHFG